MQNLHLLLLLLLSTILSVETTKKRRPKKSAPFEFFASPYILHLSSENFTTHVGSGTWAVEFYAPWCPHCKRYAPELKKAADQLINREQMSQKFSFGMAKVDCDTNVKLCDDMKVEGFPTVNLYVDGKFIEEFLGDRTAAATVEWAHVQAKKYKPKQQPKMPAAKEPAVKDTSNEQQQPKEVKNNPGSAETEQKQAKTAKDSRKDNEPRFNLQGENIALTTETFDKRVIKEGEPWFIEFYAPWCTHCKALASTWAQLGHALKGEINVGAVDCDAQSEIKNRLGIRGYPTLKMFLDGEEVSEFRGPRTLEALKEFALGFNKPAVQSVSLDDLKDLVTPRSEGGNADESNVSIVYLPRGEDAEVPPFLKKFALQNMATVDVLSTVTSTQSDPELLKLFKLSPTSAGGDSYLIIIKDSTNGQFVTHAIKSESGALDFLNANKFPLVTKLDHYNSAEMFKLGKYLVVAILDPAKGTSAEVEVVRSAAQEYTAKGSNDDVMFLWLDGQQWLSYTQRTFGIDLAQMPTVIVISPDGDEFFTAGADAKPIVILKPRIIQVLGEIKGGQVHGNHVKGWLGWMIKFFVQGSVFEGKSFYVFLLGVAALGYLFWSKVRSAEDGYNTIKSD